MASYNEIANGGDNLEAELARAISLLSITAIGLCCTLIKSSSNSERGAYGQLQHECWRVKHSRSGAGKVYLSASDNIYSPLRYTPQRLFEEGERGIWPYTEEVGDM